MILPAPPPEFVEVEDLVVGEKYHVDSGMGGVWTVTYRGRVTNEIQAEMKNYIFKDELYGRHWFEFDLPKSDTYPSSRMGVVYADEFVPQRISTIRKFKTFEEWQAAGGKFPPTPHQLGR